MLNPKIQVSKGNYTLDGHVHIHAPLPLGFCCGCDRHPHLHSSASLGGACVVQPPQQLVETRKALLREILQGVFQVLKYVYSICFFENLSSIYIGQ